MLATRLALGGGAGEPSSSSSLSNASSDTSHLARAHHLRSSSLRRHPLAALMAWTRFTLASFHLELKSAQQLARRASGPDTKSTPRLRPPARQTPNPHPPPPASQLACTIGPAYSVAPGLPIVAPRVKAVSALTAAVALSHGYVLSARARI